ncbi:MAG: hypothetical protein M0Q92_10475 [Methanoregula sp.]|jgi:hypothetical protein|nr:hypothetical protein [Methanoregula sp.]
MTSNTITDLIAATLNSRDRNWDTDSFAKLKALWEQIDPESGEFREIIHILDTETLRRAGIDTVSLPVIRNPQEVFDPVTGCHRHGQTAGLVQCLSIPGQPYFGCIVNVGTTRVRCIARRKHTISIGGSRSEFSDHHEKIPPAFLSALLRMRNEERVDIAGSCFVERPDGEMVRFHSQGDLNAISQTDFLTPKTDTWIEKSNIEKFREFLEKKKYYVEGFRNPKDSPGFYYPGMLEHQMPPTGVGCTQGFVMCSPYLKVAVIGSSIIVCLIGITLSKSGAGRRKRTDYGGWSCKKFRASELP